MVDWPTKHYGGGPDRLADPDLVKRICERLLAGETSRAIMTELGYRSWTAFSNAFLRATGERPSYYVRDRQPREGMPPGGKKRQVWSQAEREEAEKTAAEVAAAKKQAEKLRRQERRRQRRSIADPK